MEIPEKCKNCIHHKQTDGIHGDVKKFCFSDAGMMDYCDYTEYFNEIGVPVPYPYFFKQSYPCKGYTEKGQ